MVPFLRNNLFIPSCSLKKIGLNQEYMERMKLYVKFYKEV